MIVGITGFLGQTLFYVGIKLVTFWLMIVGRVVLGICIGSVYSTSCKFVAPYFPDLISTVNSINLGIGTLTDAGFVLLAPFLARVFGDENSLLTGVRKFYEKNLKTIYFSLKKKGRFLTDRNDLRFHSSDF